MFKKILYFCLFLFLSYFLSHKIYGMNTDVEVLVMNSDKNIIDSTKKIDSIDGLGGYSINDEITVSLDNTNVSDYTINCSGVNIISNTNMQIKFKADTSSEFGIIEVNANYSNGEKGKGVICTYTDGENVSVSDKSKDTAWYELHNEKYEQGLITEEEWKEEYFDLCDDFSHEIINETDTSPNANIMSVNNSNLITVNCLLKLEYEPKKHMYLRNTKVELCDKEIFGHNVLATGYTDENGEITFTYDPTQYDNSNEVGTDDLFLIWYTESKTLEVKQDLLFTFNYCRTAKIYENVTPGNVYEFRYNVIYDINHFVFKSFFVQQGMVVGEMFAEQMDFTTGNFINVIYPSGHFFKADDAFCYGNNYKEYLSIIGSNRFNDFDTLIHEYGHFVEQSNNLYGATLFEIMKNNPSHRLIDDHFDDKPEKEYAMELTWTESWANVFSLMAQKYYKNKYTNIPGFGDESLNKNNLEDYSLYNYNVKQNSCEAQELAVSKVLWDLFDSSLTGDIGESHDNISLNYTEWWRITTKPGTFTFQDFIEKLSEETIETQIKISKLLEYHQIAPSNVSAVLDSNKLKISWTPNGSINNPNNLFNIKILSLDYTDILTINNIPLTDSVGYNGTMTYELTDDQMEALNTAYAEGLNIQIVVEGIRVGASHKDASKTMQSGPYSSYPVEFRECIQLTQPTSTMLSYDIPCFEWNHLCDCSSIETVEYILKFYDEDGYEFLVIDDITTDSYTLADLEWGRVIERCNHKLKLKISCIHDNDTASLKSSGYYYFDKPIISELVLTDTITNELSVGECNWYKFIAPHTGLFNFYSYGTTDTCCGIFDNIVGGQSETGILTNGFNNNCESDGNCQCNQDNNFCITINLEENQVIYLRVHGYDWNRTGSYTIVAYSDHECSYNDRYVPSVLKHESYCECGDYILENHVIRFGTNRCMLCFAVVNNPNLELMSNQVIYITENGSYILSNGIIVLIDEDIKAYFDGTLVFHKKDEEIY